MMKTIQTVVDETPEQRTAIDEHFATMRQAQNFVVDSCYSNNETDTFRSHHLNYNTLRTQFGLPAQLAVVANKYACAAVKSSIKKEGGKPNFSGNTVHFDARSSTVNIPARTASLLTKQGRIKVKLNVPKYFENYSDWKVKESNLVRSKDGKLRLMISIETPSVISNKEGNVIGVDRGINNLIATSDGLLWEGAHTFTVKQKYVKLRAKFRSKGTHSANRHLKKIRSKEKRFVRDTNHCISKMLINSAGNNGVIVLENLKGIRNARHRKKQNWTFSNWSFNQLEEFLIYKGQEFGVAIENVPARNTSKTCSECGSLRRGQRQGSIFKCKVCNVVLHADLNAAKNILHRYLTSRAAVNQPIAPIQRLSKPPPLGGGN